MWTKQLEDRGGFQADVHPVLDLSTLICPTNPLPRRLPTGFPGASHVPVPSYVAVGDGSDSAFMTVAVNTDRCRLVQPFTTARPASSRPRREMGLGLANSRTGASCSGRPAPCRDGAVRLEKDGPLENSVTTAATASPR